MNGLLLLLGTDYTTTGTSSDTLSETPYTILTNMVNQTFARAGAA
jgi:hypothetical protein